VCVHVCFQGNKQGTPDARRVPRIKPIPWNAEVFNPPSTKTGLTNSITTSVTIELRAICIEMEI
jgi:hypothetical protein